MDDGIILRDAFQHALSPERIIHEWQKAGINPFTRAALKSKKIRHEIVLDGNGEVDSNADPIAAYLKTLQELNGTCCAILDSFGYDGSQFRIELPVRKSEVRQKERTQPHTRERQDAITATKSQGSLFLKTGGSTMNSDDYFIASERAKKLAEIEALMDQQKTSLEASQRCAKAFKILESEKLDLLYTSEELKDLIAWKSGKPCPSKISSKPKRRELWDKIKGAPIAPVKTWTNTEQQKLQQLEKDVELIPIEDTKLGRKKEETKQLLFASIPAMSEDCLLYTSPSPRDLSTSRMPSSA